MQDSTSRQCSGTLTGDIWDGLAKRKESCCKKTQTYRGIQVGAGNVADRANHGEHDQTKRQRAANMRNCPARRFVDHDRARSSEYESECPNEFRRERLHALLATQCSSQNESILARI